MIARESVYSDRSFDYESKVLTERSREDAAKSTPRVYARNLQAEDRFKAALKALQTYVGEIIVSEKAEETEVHPLVRSHPVTGRKSLFVGRHAYEIPGVGQKQGQELLDELVTFACQPPRIYTHHWQPGDVLIWDNRCVQHARTNFPPEQVRLLNRVGISGDRPF